MIKEVFPSEIKGVVKAPASKSVAQRAIALASLARGISNVYHVGSSADVRAAMGVCRELGAEIAESGNPVRINGGIRPPGGMLHCGESGLGLRMFSAIAATLSGKITLSGSGSLAQRPMNMVEDSLLAMGVNCKTRQGYLPVDVQGPLPGGVAIIDGSTSSQVLTGLLIAAPLAHSDVTLRVKDLKSQPYIDITTSMMNDFGVSVENRNYREFYIPAPQAYKPQNYHVEGDWSGAAFLLVAAAITGEVNVENMNIHSRQADKAVVQALKDCGAGIETGERHITVHQHKLQGFQFDATHCPDLFPPLVALASACKGETLIRGVSRLRVKESDRAVALQREFGKMGITIKTQGDDMLVKGGPVNGARVHSHNDHRIAMACAVAGLNARGPVVIEQTEAIDKSYPQFFNDLASLGATIKGE